MRLLGAVLAGGQSRRFGSDKALASFAGRPLIDHARAALAGMVAAVIVVGRETADGIPDRPSPGLGPLGGVNAALHYAARGGFDAVLTMPCDLPWLPPDIAARLAAGGPVAHLAALPVVGLWPATLAPVLDAHLAHPDAERSVRRWARSVGAAAMEAPGASRLPNINTPADLAALHLRDPESHWKFW